MGLKEKAKGMWNKTAGEVKEQVGKATGNSDLEARGHAQEFKGKAQSTAAKAQDKVNEGVGRLVSDDPNTNKY